jgi:hypothetical protein
VAVDAALSIAHARVRAAHTPVYSVKDNPVGTFSFAHVYFPNLHAADTFVRSSLSRCSGKAPLSACVPAMVPT